MAVAFKSVMEAGTAVTGVNSSTFATDNQLVANDVIVVQTSTFTAGAATASHTVSGGTSITWTRAHTSSSGNLRITHYIGIVAATNNAGTVITFAGPSGNHDWTVVATAYTGVDVSSGSTSALDSFNATAGAGTAWTSGTITGTDAGDAAIGGAGGDGTLRTSTATADSTERCDFNSATTGGSVTLADDENAEVNDTVAGTWSGTLTHIGIGISLNAAAAGGTTVTATQGAATAAGQDATGKTTHTATQGAATAAGQNGTGLTTHTGVQGAATAAGQNAGALVVHTATQGSATAAGQSATGKATHTGTQGAATAAGQNVGALVVHTATQGVATAEGLPATFTGGPVVTVPHICPPFGTTGDDYDTDTTGNALTTTSAGSAYTATSAGSRYDTDTSGNALVTSSTGNAYVTSTTGVAYSSDTEDWC